MICEKYLLIAVFLVAVSGCVSESTSIPPVPDVREAIAETFSYAAADYPEMSEIFREAAAYPLLLDWPIMALPIRYYINESTINYRINQTPSWFKLDSGHLEIYEVQNITI